MYIYALYYSYFELQMLLRPLGNRQFSRVPYGTAQRHTSTGMLASTRNNRQCAQLVLVHRVLILGGAAYGLRRDTKWRTRPALLCTSSLVRWKTEKKTRGRHSRQGETMRSWRYMTDSARAATNKTHQASHFSMTPLDFRCVNNSLTALFSGLHTKARVQRPGCPPIARHRGLPATPPFSDSWRGIGGMGSNGASITTSASRFWTECSPQRNLRSPRCKSCGMALQDQRELCVHARGSCNGAENGHDGLQAQPLLYNAVINVTLKIQKARPEDVFFFSLNYFVFAGVRS